MKFLRFCRILGTLCLCLFLILAHTPLPNLLYDWMAVSSRAEPAQAVVVLGSNVNRDGVLDEASLRRALRGIQLHRKGLAPVILFFGYTRPDGRKEAEVRAALARELGVAGEAILMETRARTTREEAALAWGRLQPKGLKRILLVTDPQHLVRAERLFAGAGFGVLPAAADEYLRTAESPEGRMKLSRQVLQELLALAYYRVAGYL
jgi:uncharacterized SAM-binding protein YcdF (DUF218 family)